MEQDDTINKLSHNEHILLRITSRLSIISIVSAILHQSVEFTLMGCMVLFTSIGYWDNPIQGTRKNIDVFNVCFWTVYCIIRATYIDNVSTRTMYYAYLFIAISYFITCQIVSYYDYPWVMFHCGVHIFSNIANQYLFYGLY